MVQSPWFIDGQRKGESSVEERIVDVVLPAFKADRHKFMTAGTASNMRIQTCLVNMHFVHNFSFAVACADP